jgi:hypothetical protein
MFLPLQIQSSTGPLALFTRYFNASTPENGPFGSVLRGNIAHSNAKKAPNNAVGDT